MAQPIFALSDKDHWDDLHLQEDAQTTHSRLSLQPRSRHFASRTAASLKEFVRQKLSHRFAAYDEYQLWEHFFPKLLPDLNGRKVLEIGSAPGDFLVRFSKAYGCQPYGVEYSEIGADVNRRLFWTSGFNPENVVHADVFSEDFLRKYAGAFDLVISRGFIEHFTEVAAVIDRHMLLLTPGGHLLVSIPNLRGLNYALVRLFHPEVIAIHNLAIMRKDVFAKLFDRDDLDTSFCDFYGTFSFFLFNAKQDSPRRHALNVAFTLQPFLNAAFRALLGTRGLETAYCSPYLLFVGRKHN